MIETLRQHGRYPYWPITQPPPFRWPQGEGLAVYVALNLEAYAFGDGMLDEIVPVSPAPDVLNYSWLDYGNRVGAWRILDGDGAGWVAREERFGAISHPQGVVAAYFNHDGWLDVAIAGSGINIVAVFYSTATGGMVQKNVTVGGAVNVLTSGDFKLARFPIRRV